MAKEVGNPERFQRTNAQLSGCFGQNVSSLYPISVHMHAYQPSFRGYSGTVIDGTARVTASRKRQDSLNDEAGRTYDMKEALMIYGGGLLTLILIIILLIILF